MWYLDNPNFTLDQAGYTLDGSSPGAYRPQSCRVSCPVQSPDGIYYGRYPNGKASAALAAAASDTITAQAALTALIRLGALAADVTAANAALTTAGPAGLSPISRGTGSLSNRLVDNNGNVIQLRGFNLSGLETSTVQQNQPWYGNPPNYAYAKTWKPTAIRVPLNAAAFLNLSCLTINSAGTGWNSTTTVKADYFGNYIAAVDAAIAAIQAIGAYVILDLHWSAPKLTFNSVTGYAMPLWQPAFMNADTDLQFWQAIANRYGSQATPQAGINNSAILFELFNEPYLDQVTFTTSGSGSPPTRNGTTLNDAHNPPDVQYVGSTNTADEPFQPLVTTSVSPNSGELLIMFTTASPYNGGGKHTGWSLTSSNSADKITLLEQQDENYSNPNSAQDTIMWWMPVSSSGARTFTQEFQGLDNDYQSFAAFRFANTSQTIIGHSSIGGTNTFVAKGTNNIKSGLITVTQAQCPCTLLGFAFNLSQAGSGYLPVPGTGMTADTAMWAFFQSGGDNVQTATMEITTAGSYQALFSQNSSSAQCTQCFAVIVSGKTTSGGSSTLTASQVETLMKSGGNVTQFPTNGATGQVNQSWVAEGYQSVLSAIRTIGAHNVCVFNGPGYAHSTANYTTYLPTDTLTPAQLAVGAHFYPAGNYPNTNGYPYPLSYPDAGSGTSSWDTPAKAVLSGGYPLLITEAGGSYGPAASSGEPAVTYLTQWADTEGASLLEWTFVEGSSPPASNTSGINWLQTSSSTPTEGQGQVFHDWLVNHGGTTPLNVTTTSEPAGQVGVADSYTVAATGGTAPYTWTVSGLPAGLSGAPTTSGTPTTAGSYSVKYTVTDAVGATASSTFTLTINGAALTITTTALNSGTVGTAYSQQLAGSTGTWTASPLPAGLSCSTGGLISGTPTAPVSDSVVIDLSATGSTTVTKTLTLTVNAAVTGNSPNAPTDFFVTLQGQTAQGSSTYRPGTTDPAYNIPNDSSISFGWPDAIATAFPIAHYEIQRTTDNGTTWTSPAGGTAITTGAANSQGTRFKDTGCPNAASSTYGPTSGQYLVAPAYMHRLRAVDSQGNPSAWVTGANQYIYYGASGGKSVSGQTGPSTGGGGGFKWVGDLSSGYPINYAVSDPIYTYVATIDMSSAGGGYFLPTTGCNYCTYNQNIGGCDYLYFLLKTTNASMNISMHTEVVGDHPMTPGGAPPANLNGNALKFSAYVVGGTVLANTYQTYKIPLGDLQTPQAGFGGSSSAIGIRQNALYKFLWQAANGAVVTLAKAWVGK